MAKPVSGELLAEFLRQVEHEARIPDHGRERSLELLRADVERLRQGGNWRLLLLSLAARALLLVDRYDAQRRASPVRPCRTTFAAASHPQD